ncbi:MAG: hypothetical protein U1F37_03575 [Alphaproteobacteria bacterium]
MSLATRLKMRAPRLASALAVLRALPVGWRKRGSTAHDYVQRHYEIGGHAPGHDLAAALAVRAALEGRHAAVAEIGAASGGRILTLKRLLPHVEAYAFDIGESYRAPSEREGVKFRLLEDGELAALPPGTLIFSRGTLCYLTGAEIETFVARAGERRHDLAIVEPMPLFDLGETVKRGGSSWYHPYPSLLARHGFSGQPGRAEGAKHSDSLGMLECWYAAWARAGSAR